MAFHTGKTLLRMAITGWLETEALLRGGDDALARAEVERIAAVVYAVRWHPTRRMFFSVFGLF